MISIIGAGRIPTRKPLDEKQIKKIMEKTKSSGMDVISLKGSTTHAPAAVIGVMAEAIIKEKQSCWCFSRVTCGTRQEWC